MGDYGKISIHAPRAGRDGLRYARICKTYKFQSTRPVRGATSGTSARTPPCCDFNPRAPCGARRAAPCLSHKGICISIHAPRAGRDRRFWRCSRRPRYFNPRAPCGARQTYPMWELENTNFNPRAPCGARLARRWQSFIRGRFQSTRPVRGATRHRRGIGQRPCISIHAPRAGRDKMLTGDNLIAVTFQSTRPVRGATTA